MSTEKEFIKDGLTNEEIIMTIKEIIEKKKLDENKKIDVNERYEKLKKEFDFFSTRYPMLFDLTLRDNEFDWNSLNYFMNMRKNIIENKMTSEDATIKVGKDWFDKHIDISKLEKNKKQRK